MTPQDAAAALLRRRAARADLRTWCTKALEPLGQKPARHHLKIIERLEALSRGEIDRLMVLAPPGAAKSTYVSHLFPAWWLAQNPAGTVIAASHTAELAQRFGRKVRNTVAEHGRVLGYSLAPDNAAAGRWETDRGGEYFAAGVMGPITGRRADLCVIDDPVKSRVEADSQTIQDRTWEWWLSDLSTRLKPGAKVVLVMTRWSESDLGGRLLEDMQTGGKPWEVLRFPMVSEGAGDPLHRPAGEMLWPDWFNEDMLASAKRDARTWGSLYQQNPVPDEGDYFQRDWVRAAQPPARSAMRVFGASDYAVTADGGDYTVHVVVGVDADDRIYVLDLWRQQTTSEMWVEAFCDMVIRWKPMGWAEETGQIRASIGPWLDRRQRERRAFVARTQFPTRGDKAVRAQSIRGRMALSGLFVPSDAAWRADFETELMAFPAGKHDDQVDALGLVGQLLDRMLPPSRPKADRAPVDTWARAFAGGDADGDSDWKTV